MPGGGGSAALLPPRFLPPPVHSAGSDEVPGLPVFALDGQHRGPRAVLLKRQSAPPVCAAVLVMEERGARVVAHHLAVRRGRPLHSPVTAAGAGTYARVAARRTRAPTVHGNVYQIAVEYGSVGWGPHRFSVEFPLLFRVPELQGAGPLVRRRLLPVRQGDGGGKVDLMLHIGVGGLETAEPVPLDKGWGSKPVPGPRGIHDLQGKEERVEEIPDTMTTNVMVARKFMLGLCSRQFEDFPNSPQNRKQREKTISGKKKSSFLIPCDLHHSPCQTTGNLGWFNSGDRLTDNLGWTGVTEHTMYLCFLLVPVEYSSNVQSSLDRNGEEECCVGGAAVLPTR